MPRETKAERRLRRRWERTPAGRAAWLAREEQMRKAAIKASIETDVQENKDWGETRDSFLKAIGKGG